MQVLMTKLRPRLSDPRPARVCSIGDGWAGRRGWRAWPVVRRLGQDRFRTAQFWLGWAAMFSSDRPGALDHFTALRDAAGPEPSPTAAAAAPT